MSNMQIFFILKTNKKTGKRFEKVKQLVPFKFKRLERFHVQSLSSMVLQLIKLTLCDVNDKDNVSVSTSEDVKRFC